MVNIVSAAVIPAVIGMIALTGLYKKSPVFDLFMEGVKEGLTVVLKITPPIIGLLVAVTMLNASGVWDILSRAFSPLSRLLGFPAELVPLGLLRPVSGSGSLALLKDIYDRSGADSFTAFAASILMASSETTFYTIAVYYGAAGIKRIRYTLPAALLCDLAAFIAAMITAKTFY